MMVFAVAAVWVRLGAEKQLEMPRAFVNLVFVHGKSFCVLLVWNVALRLLVLCE
jgi:hypothetical protein